MKNNLWGDIKGGGEVRGSLGGCGCLRWRLGGFVGGKSEAES